MLFRSQAIVGFGLIVFELLSRGYRVIVSTHSPVLLDLVWATQELRDVPAASARRAFKKIFQLDSLTASSSLWSTLSDALNKSYRTYYFDRGADGVVTRDISSLDPGDPDPGVAGWGGLSGFSGDIADAVGEAVSQ